MTNPTNFIAIKTHLVWILLCALFAVGMLSAGSVYAQTVGKVIDLSGPLLARKSGGVVKVLTQTSVVEQGDLLESEKNTYARIKFIDNSEITLRPNTQFRIENFSFDEARPENDSSVFGLIKGGLRSITGLLGKRNKEKYKLNTPAATIGIRGTTFIAEYLPPTTQNVALYLGTSYAARDADRIDNLVQSMTDDTGGSEPIKFDPWNAGKRGVQLAQNNNEGGGGRNPGLYVAVLDGTIAATNAGGTQLYTAGQFGYVANFVTPPIVLPNDPGMIFTPPASFSTTLSEDGTGGGSGVGPGDVDCQVR